MKKIILSIKTITINQSFNSEEKVAIVQKQENKV